MMNLRSLFLFFFLSFLLFPDVGMIMMQTGMVKQGLNSYQRYMDGMPSSIKRVDASIIYIIAIIIGIVVIWCILYQCRHIFIVWCRLIRLLSAS